MARQQRAEESRRKLLMAAAEVFDERGFALATLTEIHNRAGLTKGALYFHFSSKEELAAAVVAEEATWFGEVDVSGPPMQAVIDLSHGFAKALLQDVRIRASTRLVLEHTYVGPDGESHRAWAKRLAELMAQAQQAGDFRPELDPTPVSELVVGSFLGVQTLSQLFANRSDLEARVTLMWQVLLPGLVPASRLARFAPGGSPKVWAVDPEAD
ncbi:ScbR family autoregulator-binding transcription factor [Streptacidiphilus sp. P02-A3a]|uniref:ScbR family autoregulator-binding transcription factor n=1 Tax=Streptacidiphilus sp. P02-A3a TaxID=2704468 RepID=UPI0015FB2DAE|nr:ScbR family autoregulator-binding transcription factor [Streptacidiphilus sp. P02-A3a]QMU67971.1 TetR family transcriptional regulator [Streptacidiphilus sp. P02-A3a]